jgi:signal transduction histidine kinase
MNYLWHRGLALTRGTRADVILATLAGLLDILLTSDGLTGFGSTGSLVVFGYAIPGYAALAVRQRAPTLVLAAMLAHTIGAVLLLPDFRPILGALVALYTVASHRSLGPSIASLSVTYLVSSTVSITDELSRPLAPMDTPGGVVRAILGAMLLLDLAAWGVGRWARASRQNAAVLRQLGDMQRREAVAAERASIARDMHDTVSHAITAVLLHAAGARRMLPRDPREAEVSLAYIEEAATQAMKELRNILVLLREPADTERAQPLVLDDLVERTRSTGLAVEEEVEGVPHPLPRVVAEVAVRVVQEGLTNSAKYAGPGSTVVIRQRWTGTGLMIEIRDDGAGRRLTDTPCLSGGTGLSGLRERVTALGGRLDAAPAPDGGYVLLAELPVSPLPMSFPSPVVTHSG